MKRGLALAVFLIVSILGVVAGVYFVEADGGIVSGGTGSGGGGGAVIVGESVALFSGGEKINVNDPLNKVKTVITKSDLPNFLGDSSFGGDVGAFAGQVIEIGENPKVVFGKYPTVDDYPSYALETSVVSSNPIYTSKIIFNKAVDFTSIDSIDIDDKKITLFGEEFIVNGETNSNQLVLSNDDKKLIFVEGSAVLSGDSETSIDGTKVSFNGNVNSLYGIDISVFAPDSASDAIKQGESFVDPVFGTFSLDFTGLNIDDEDAVDRELISINNVGDDKMSIEFDSHLRTGSEVLMFAKNTGSRFGLYSDDDNRKFIVSEGEDIHYQDLVLLGNGNEAHLVRLTSVNNATTGYINDRVKFTDVFKDEDGNYNSYKADFTVGGEGHGTLYVGGKSYGVTLIGDSSTATEDYIVRIDYPDSSGEDVILYPNIETSLGAKIMFYEPMEVDNGVIMIPEVNSYFNWDLSSLSDVWIGRLNFVSEDSGAKKKIYLKDVSGQIINGPAVVIFEEEGNEALIVKIEEGIDASDGIGVDSVERTWNDNDVSWEVIVPGDSTVMKSGDKYGSIITIDSSDADQKTAIISYPDSQLEANIYISSDSSPSNDCSNHEFTELRVVRTDKMDSGISKAGFIFHHNNVQDVEISLSSTDGSYEKTCNIQQLECDKYSPDYPEYCFAYTDCIYPDLLNNPNTNYWGVIKDVDCGNSMGVQITDYRNACDLLDENVYNRVTELRQKGVIKTFEQALIGLGEYFVNSSSGGEVWKFKGIRYDETLITIENDLTGVVQNLDVVSNGRFELKLKDGSIADLKYDEGYLSLSEKPHNLINEYYCHRKVGIDLYDGWNLVSLFALGEVMWESSSEEYLDDLNIRAVYLYDKFNGNYIRLHPQKESQKLDDFMELMGNSGEGDGESGFIHSSLWIYSEKDQNINFEIPDDKYLDLNRVGLTKRWNFLAITPQMLGLSLNEIKGTCEIEKAAFWSNEYNNWDVGSEEDFEKYEFTEEDLWEGLVVKVSDNCMLSDIPVNPPLPDDDLNLYRSVSDDLDEYLASKGYNSLDETLVGNDDYPGFLEGLDRVNAENFDDGDYHYFYGVFLFDEEVSDAKLESIFGGYLNSIDSGHCIAGVREGGVVGLVVVPVNDEFNLGDEVMEVFRGTMNNGVDLIVCSEDYPAQIGDFERVYNSQHAVGDYPCYDYGTPSTDNPDNLFIGEVCMNSFRMDYKNPETNRGVFISVSEINSGWENYINFIEGSSGMTDITFLYTLESHEIWWVSPMHKMIFTQEYSYVEDGSGTTYQYDEPATAQNEVSQWFLNRYPAVNIDFPVDACLDNDIEEDILVAGAVRYYVEDSQGIMTGWHIDGDYCSGDTLYQLNCDNYEYGVTNPGNINKVSTVCNNGCQGRVCL